MRNKYIMPRQWARLLEPVVIVLITSFLSIWVPLLFSCTPADCATRLSTKCLLEPRHPLHPEIDLEGEGEGEGEGEIDLWDEGMGGRQPGSRSCQRCQMSAR